MSPTTVQVLGPVLAHDAQGVPIELKGPRHREVLARLVAARGRVVPLDVLVEDLWGGGPPRRAVGSVRTFISALRGALEPGRRPGDPPRLIVTVGEGYALRADSATVDAWRFAAVLDTTGDDDASAAGPLEQALSWWQGPAFADFPDASWARSERARLSELRLLGVERLAGARLAAGDPRAVVADLGAHVTDHPWREHGWWLLALALYRCDRQGDALAVLRRGRRILADQLGLEPGPALASLELDVLQRAPQLESTSNASSADRVWAEVTADWQHSPAVGPRAKLESATTLLRSLAVHGGGPATASARQATVVSAAEELGDLHLLARTIGGYDVPSVWARSDDPDSSARVVAAAQRLLVAAPELPVADRVRVLSRVAIETRGLPGPRGPDAARQAEHLARSTGDPALTALALAGRLMHSFHQTGLGEQRLRIAEDVLTLTAERDLPTLTVLGHVARMQARAGLGDLDAAGRDARVLLDVAERFDLPQLGVLVAWFEAMRADTEDAPDREDRYRAAARLLEGAGMPGVEQGLLDLALVCGRLRRGQPLGPVVAAGPYEPWIRPHLLLADGRTTQAAAVVKELPDPPPDHLLEVLWCLTGLAASRTGQTDIARRAVDALRPAAREIAGAGSAMLTFGPVAIHLHLMSTEGETT